MSDETTAPGDEAGPPRAAREELLAQREIDAAAGHLDPEGAPAASAGVRAMLDTGAGPRAPMPMLPVVLRDLAGRLAESLRGPFGGDVGTGLAGLVSLRYEDAVDQIVLPAHVATFRAEGWDGCALLAVGPDFAALAMDALLGAGRGMPAGQVTTRPFSAIERAILTRLTDVVLGDAEAAFSEVAPVRFVREQVETDPRLADVAAPGDVVARAALELTFEGRSATAFLVLPFATLAPVRGLFEQDFAGQKGGRDPHWAGHFATEIWQATLEAEAVLHECPLPLRRVLDLAVGDTVMFDMKPTDLVEVRSGGRVLTRGRIGRVGGRIAVQVVESVGGGAGEGARA